MLPKQNKVDLFMPFLVFVFSLNRVPCFGFEFPLGLGLKYGINFQLDHPQIGSGLSQPRSQFFGFGFSKTFRGTHLFQI